MHNPKAPKVSKTLYVDGTNNNDKTKHKIAGDPTKEMNTYRGAYNVSYFTPRAYTTKEGPFKNSGKVETDRDIASLGFNTMKMYLKDHRSRKT